jgi:hypothetical protein
VPLPEPSNALLGSWELAPGRTHEGWQIESILQSVHGGAIILLFAREADRVSVTLRRASEAPKFKRIGEIDVSYTTHDPQLESAAYLLARVVAAILRANDLWAALVPHLADTEPAEQPSLYNVVVEAPPLDPARRTRTDRPFFQFEWFDLADAGRYHDVMRRIYREEFGGFIVRGVYTREEMARVVAGIEAGKVRSLPALEMEPFDDAPLVEPDADRAHFVGRGLESSADLDRYLTDARRFRAETEAMFAEAGVQPFESRIREVFSQLADGCEVRSPRHVDGRDYSPATIRVLPPGGRLPPHCGNHMIGRPPYAPLLAMVDPRDQLSYFLTLQDAEQDGSLVVYSVRFSGQEASERTDEEGRLDLAEWMELRPGPGDLLVFDGGRYTHQVTRVAGSRTRLTMGGFCMFDRTGRILYFWG